MNITSGGKGTSLFIIIIIILCLSEWFDFGEDEGEREDDHDDDDEMGDNRESTNDSENNIDDDDAGDNAGLYSDTGHNKDSNRGHGAEAHAGDDQEIEHDDYKGTESYDTDEVNEKYDEIVDKRKRDTNQNKRYKAPDDQDTHSKEKYHEKWNKQEHDHRKYLSFIEKHILTPESDPKDYYKLIRHRMSAICDGQVNRYRKWNTFYVPDGGYTNQLPACHGRNLPNCYCSDQKVKLFHLKVKCASFDKYEILYEGKCHVIVSKDPDLFHLDGIDFQSCEPDYFSTKAEYSDKNSFYNGKCSQTTARDHGEL